QHGAVDLHREVLAAAERAAHAREMDPDLLLAEPQTRSHLVAVDVQPLGRDVDVDAAFAVRNGESRLGPEERLILDSELVVALDGDIARRLWVAAADSHVPHDVRPGIVAKAVTKRPVLRVDRLLVHRSLHVDDRLPGLAPRGRLWGPAP